MENLICLSEEPRVRTCPLQGNAPDSGEKDHRSPSTLYDLLTSRAVSGSSGKMFRAYSVPVAGETSQPFYPCFPDAQLKSPEKALPPQDLFAMLDATDTVWHGACWTLSLPEFPDFHSPFRSADGCVRCRIFWRLDPCRGSIT